MCVSVCLIRIRCDMLPEPALHHRDNLRSRRRRDLYIGTCRRAAVRHPGGNWTSRTQNIGNKPDDSSDSCGFGNYKTRRLRVVSLHGSPELGQEAVAQRLMTTVRWNLFRIAIGGRHKNGEATNEWE